MRNEITEYHIYLRLANSERVAKNAIVLRRIADEEHRHYEFWKSHIGADVRPRRLLIGFDVLIARLLGLTFAVKLMEKGEQRAQHHYRTLTDTVQGAQEIEQDEERHEQELLALIDEERLSYIGSMVLGLNDALVELTGALAGLTLALRDTRLVALAGLITGIAASLSMAASEYLSTKSEQSHKSPVKAAVYTGFAYVLTVIVLILPYLLISTAPLALALTLAAALCIIFVFTSYVSVAQDLPFWSRFLEMAGISIGVATITFAIGAAIRQVWNVDV